MTQVPENGLVWHRSSSCADSACVEVAATDTWIYLRDTKKPDDGVLRFTRTEWADFYRGTRLGEFDSL